MIFPIVAVAMLMAVANAQQQQHTTPVPILKQINRHNEDGSYSYGYEAADGSFKIESKYPDGQVFGKYGYVDESGKVREVEYGASKRGFEPAGSGINVAPPTLHNDKYQPAPLAPGQQDDGQYREDPSVYYSSDEYNAPVQQRPTYKQQPTYNQQPTYSQQPTVSQQPTYKQQPAFRPQSNLNLQSFFNEDRNNNYQQPQQQYQPQPQPQPQYQPQYQPQPQPQYQPQSQYQPQPQYQPQQSQSQSHQYYNQPQQRQYYQPQQSFNRPAPIQIDPNQFRGHPASNFDVGTGSYSIQY